MKFLIQNILFLLCFAQAAAQSYHFQQFNVGDGLPQSQVYAMLHDSRGYLWLGTQGGGLARFDGEEFRNFSVSDGLAGNYVQAIAEDTDGDIWIGTNDGVSRFDGRQFENFRSENVPNLKVQGMAFDTESKLWLAAQQGIFVLSDGEIILQKKTDGSRFGRMWTAFADSQGTVWMGGGDGVFRKEKGSDSWQHIWKREAEVLAFAEAPDGRIMAGVFDLGLRIWDGKKWERLTFEDGLPSNRIQAIWTAPDGQIWVGSQNYGIGVFTLPENIGTTRLDVTYLTENQGLCNKNIRCIAGDRWGNVWLGTSGGGLCKYGGQEFEHFTRSDGLNSNFIYSMATDTTGGMWLSAGDRGVSFWLGDSLTHFDSENGFYDFKCRAMHRDSKGRIWIGTEGAGIATPIAPDSTGLPRFRLINRNSGLAGNWIRDIAEDAAGNLWVATTDGGFGRVTVNDLASGSFNFKNFGAAEGLTVNAVNQLHFDKTGQLWIASQGRGLFFKPPKDDHIGRYKMPPVTVRSMAEDASGNLWFGTAGQGIGRLEIYSEKYSAAQLFGKDVGLASANVYLLQFDPEGRLWVGTERGVDRITLDASGNPVEVRHFGLAEGFRGVEVCQNSSLLDEQGNLWFGTVNGLTRYKTSQSDTGRAVAPQVHFTSVNLFYEPLENTDFGHLAKPWIGLGDSAVFPHNQNHLGFEFFAPNFSNPKRVEYSWQLVGSEEGWSPFAKRNEVSYANLPPGDYTFQVRARNEDGMVGEAVSASFQIETPYWQTTWFRLTIAGLVAALIGLLFWLRIRRLRKKAKLERERLEMENHLLQLEQKARQLQMNPHFIFNALNSIQSLVSRGDTDGARSYILKFGRLMRAVLDNSRQELIPLEKEVDTLRKYLEMEQFCRDGNFDFTIQTDSVESDDLQLPPMLLQPFVENAILHGVAPLKNRRGHIEVVFSEGEKSLQVEVTDNGVGFSEARSEKREVRKDRTSAGVAVTRERVALLGGKLDISAGAENGTRVVLEIPIE